MKQIIIDFDEKEIDENIALNTIYYLVFPIEIKNHWAKRIRLK